MTQTQDTDSVQTVSPAPAQPAATTWTVSATPSAADLDLMHDVACHFDHIAEEWNDARRLLRRHLRAALEAANVMHLPKTDPLCVALYSELYHEQGTGTAHNPGYHAYQVYEVVSAYAESYEDTLKDNAEWMELLLNREDEDGVHLGPALLLVTFLFANMGARQ